MATDAQTNYRRALKRAEEALAQLDKAKGHFEAKRVHGELELAIKTLHAAKLALLRESTAEPDKPKKIIRLSDRYFK